MLHTHLSARLLLGLSALAFVPVAGVAAEADGVLKRAVAAMGDPATLRFEAEGRGFTFGQAYLPGQAWPKITVHSLIRTINYGAGAMREEITLSRAEPKGGGGYPLAGQQRNDQYVNGNFAWNLTPAPLPGPRFVADRTHQMWITPHGVLKAAARNRATVDFSDKGGRSLAAVSFVEPGRFRATAYINENYLVERVESVAPDPVLGEVKVVTRYSAYRDQGGVKFPGRIEQRAGGYDTLDVIVGKVETGVAAEFAVPDVVKGSERVVVDKAAEGVWFIGGGSHNSVAIEMKDHLVLVETPLGDLRSGPVIEAVQKLVPGKPLRTVVNSHQHFDHSGGLRTAIAAGATIVTQEANKAYYDKVFNVRNSIAPDLMAKSGKKPKIVGFKDKHVLTDGSRRIELHRITGGPHNESFVMAYLPAEKILIEADAFTPGAANAAPPSPANANNVNLVDNIERLKLDVAQILPLHGRPVAIDELYRVTGRTNK